MIAEMIPTFNIQFVQKNRPNLRNLTQDYTMTCTFARLSRAPAPCIRGFRQFSTATSRRQTAIPYTQTCPSPTCECAATPPDLDIDRKSPLLNTMAAYSEQVIFCTGKEDWASNIEQEEGETGDFVKGLKGVVGRGGVGFDVGWFPQFCQQSPYTESANVYGVLTAV